MPCGKVHSTTSAIIAAPAFLAGTAIGGVSAGCAAAIGCLCGIMLTPDLDQESISSSEYWLIKWTMGLGFFWTMIWYPYARCCKHRSNISHFPLLGTAGRLAYLTVILAVILYFFVGRVPQVNWIFILWGIAGLAVADIAHYIMDVYCGEIFALRSRAHTHSVSHRAK